MAADTSWQCLLDDISSKMRKTKGFSRFAKLKTNEEKIEFCLKDDYTKIKILKWLRIICSSRHKKYWEKSSELRIEGNACFQRKEYDKALELYTRSILTAPCNTQSNSSGEELALAYGNRSAALFFLNKFTQCLEDIDRAIDNGYPRDLCYKLYFRKAQCLSKIGPRAAALKALDETLTHIKNAKIEPKKLEKYTRESAELKATLIEFTENKENGNHSHSDESVPRLSYGCQSALAFGSSCLEARHNEAKGRFIVTNRPIKAGDTVIVEKPYTSVLLPNHYLTHCHHCYFRLEAAVPCYHCSQVRYCSINCVDQSWKRYHRWECGNLDLLHSVGIAHLGFRLLVVTGLQNLIDFYGRSLEPLNHHVPHDNSYYNVFHLVTHADLLHIEDSFQYALTSTLILLLLERIGFTSSNSKDDQGEDRMKDAMVTSLRQMELSPLVPRKSAVACSSSSSRSYESNSIPSQRPESLRLYLGGLILRHIHQLVCNAHAITALIKYGSSNVSGGVVTQKQVRIATAIYPTSSLMNHSCDPSIITSFYKDVLIVKAVKNVSTGGEIFNCYGPHFKRMSKEERQKALKEQYGFICDCQACLGEEEREQRFQGLKCSACGGPLRLPDANNHSSCMDCNTEQECATQLQKAFSAHDMFVQGLQLAARGNFRDALERLRRCLKMREKVMYKLHRQLAEVQDQIARCYASLGEYCLAVEYLRPTLEATEATYGENSVELANELQKFTDLLLNAILQLAKEGYSLKSSVEVRELMKEALDVTDRADKIFVLHYGARHESVQELRSKRDEILKLSKPKAN